MILWMVQTCFREMLWLNAIVMVTERKVLILGFVHDDGVTASARVVGRASTPRKKI